MLSLEVTPVGLTGDGRFESYELGPSTGILLLAKQNAAAWLISLSLKSRSVRWSAVILIVVEVGLEAAIHNQ